MGTSCAPLLSDQFLHSYKANLRENPIQWKEFRLTRLFDRTYLYIDDVLSLSSPSFEILYIASTQKNLE